MLNACKGVDGCHKYGQSKGKFTCNNRHNLAPHQTVTAAQPFGLEVEQAPGTPALVQSDIKQPSTPLYTFSMSDI